LAVNVRLYRFFFRKRGLQFTIQSIPWHWLYFFYSGIAFALGIVRYAAHRCGPAPNKTRLLSKNHEVQGRL
jgi:hypothetical protein